MESQSAISLTTALTNLQNGNKVRRVKSDGRYTPTKKSVIVNWGNSNPPRWDYVDKNLLNLPEKVEIAANKLKTLSTLSEVPEVNIPLFTTEREEATEWVNEGATVICRTKLNAHSGAGIFVASREEDIVHARLYTKYIKKKKEFRVHVFQGKVIDIQQKKARTGIRVDYTVRNFNNGWVFCRDDIEYSEELIQQAIKAVEVLGLDFGAVDIVYNQHQNKYFVLEVNSAPGLEGTTLQRYVESINEYFLA